MVQPNASVSQAGMSNPNLPPEFVKKPNQQIAYASAVISAAAGIPSGSLMQKMVQHLPSGAAAAAESQPKTLFASLPDPETLLELDSNHPDEVDVSLARSAYYHKWEDLEVDSNNRTIYDECVRRLQIYRDLYNQALGRNQKPNSGAAALQPSLGVPVSAAAAGAGSQPKTLFESLPDARKLQKLESLDDPIIVDVGLARSSYYEEWEDLRDDQNNKTIYDECVRRLQIYQGLLNQALGHNPNPNAARPVTPPSPASSVASSNGSSLSGTPPKLSPVPALVAAGKPPSPTNLSAQAHQEVANVYLASAGYKGPLVPSAPPRDLLPPSQQPPLYFVPTPQTPPPAYNLAAFAGNASGVVMPALQGMGGMPKPSAPPSASQRLGAARYAGAAQYQTPSGSGSAGVGASGSAGAKPVVRPMPLHSAPVLTQGNVVNVNQAPANDEFINQYTTIVLKLKNLAAIAPGITINIEVEDQVNREHVDPSLRLKICNGKEIVVIFKTYNDAIISNQQNIDMCKSILPKAYEKFGFKNNGIHGWSL